MQELTGNWSLIKMKDFDKFLIFIKFNSIVTQILKNVSVKLIINKNNDESYQKKITSPFYSVNEKILLDQNYYDYDKFTKKYRFENNMVICKAKYPKYKLKWQEVIYIKNENLYVDFMWQKNKKDYFARQIFKKTISK